MANVVDTTRININIALTVATGFLAGVAEAIQRTFSTVFRTSGTAADQVDLVYAATLTFAASTAQTLNLSSLTDINGGAINFARVRKVAIRVKSTTDGASLTVGAAASTPFVGFLNSTGTLVVPSSSAANNDGFFVITAPNTTGMVVGSGVSLKLLPSAHAFDVDIIITGCSA